MFTARLPHGPDELFGLDVVMNINEKKYALLLAESLRRRTTSYDMIRRTASKSTDDVVLIKSVLISAYSLSYDVVRSLNAPLLN
jgi:hypothetical protein